MNCRDYRLLLEDYIDREMTPDKETALLDHVKTCRTCQTELAELRRLKEILQQAKPPVPDSVFFRESEQVIFARTTGIPTYTTDLTAARKEKSKAEFVRSIVAVAASLILFASAVYLGTLPSNEQLTTLDKDQPVYVLTPVPDNPDYHRAVYAKADQVKQMKGMMLIGPPGTLGRFMQLYEFSQIMP